MKELLTRTGTGILLVLLFVGSIQAGPWTMVLMLLLIYVLGARELSRAANEKGPGKLWLPFVAAGSMISLAFATIHFSLNPLWLSAPFLLWIPAHLVCREKKSLLLMFWLALPLSAFMGLSYFPDKNFSPLFPTAVIALVWISDTLSYICGRLLGKHPFTPTLSPGKTWEGFLGGVILTTLSAWLFYHFTGAYTATTWFISGFLVSLLGVVGDLFESRIKRSYGLKDMGNLLPGHGGILDRFDSLFFVAPAVFLLLLLQQGFA